MMLKIVESVIKWLEIKICKLFQAESAKAVKLFLLCNNEDKAIQMIGEMEDALRWRDAEYANETLIHHAAKRNCKHFLQQILKNEKVLYILCLKKYI